MGQDVGRTGVGVGTAESKGFAGTVGVADRQPANMHVERAVVGRWLGSP